MATFGDIPASTSEPPASRRTNPEMRQSRPLAVLSLLLCILSTSAISLRTDNELSPTQNVASDAADTDNRVRFASSQNPVIQSTPPAGVATATNALSPANPGQAVVPGSPAPTVSTAPLPKPPPKPAAIGAQAKPKPAPFVERIIEFPVEPMPQVLQPIIVPGGEQNVAK